MKCGIVVFKFQLFIAILFRILKTNEQRYGGKSVVAEDVLTRSETDERISHSFLFFFTFFTYLHKNVLAMDPIIALCNEFGKVGEIHKTLYHVPVRCKKS
jgi:hypothetical protein